MASFADEKRPTVRRCLHRWLLYWLAAVFAWRSRRPRDCYQKNRAELIPLPADTRLFFRFFCNNATPSGLPTKAGIPCPDQSVNCLVGGGRPWFLLLPEPGQNRKQNHRGRCSGIVELQRDAFPLAFAIGKINYTARVEHDPKEHNYQHCEIRIYANGVRVQLEDAKRLDQRDYEKLVTTYRAMLAKRIQLTLWPNRCTKPDNWDLRGLAKTACSGGNATVSK